jgi:hypothetical protein
MRTVRLGIMRCFVLLVAFIAACKPAPPPAPEGLDASARYMIREFHRSDAVFQAGLQGFMEWFDAEGYLLVGATATADTTDSFTVGDLVADDVAHLPLEPNELRDVANAKGVVSLAEMECSFEDAEDLLVRSDQDTVFDAWEGYERTYVTPRADYEAATRSGEFALADEDMDVFADDWEPGPLTSTLLITDNRVDPKAVLIDLPWYDQVLHFRHGSFLIDDEPARVFAILTYVPQEIFGDGGVNGLRQTYAVEINIERAADRTLRLFALWAEPVSDIADPDDPFVLNYAVNTAQSNAQLLTDICSGTLEIPPEP